MAKKIYLDYAAATPVAKEVVTVMSPLLSKHFANPSSIHALGEEANELVDSARNKIAKLLACQSQEIFFTSSGSESINLAIQGIARTQEAGHIITSSVEHAATLQCCRWLEAQGYSVTYLDPDHTGKITASKVQAAIQENTILVSLMYVNNEVGTIDQVAKIAKVTHNFKIPFHLDACQAANYCSVNIKELGVDLMTVNASKLYGPKGAALLYKKSNLTLKPLIFGGKQEFSLRAGTLNLPAIVGFAKALEISEQKKTREKERLTLLRDDLITELLKLPDAYLNGHKQDRVANNINISFLGVDSETLVLALSAQGIFVSSGSACSQGIVKSSHVLEAMGFDKYRSQSSIRISLGQETTIDDVKYISKIIKRTVGSLRKVNGI